MPTPLDAQYWQEEEEDFWDIFAPLIIAMLYAGIKDGIKTLPISVQQLVDWDGVNMAAVDFARRYRYTLIKDITDTTRTQVQNAIVNWIQTGSPLDVLKAQLEPIFGEVRAKRIAVTEVTRVFSEGNRQAWEKSGYIDELVWHTAEDDRVCDICAPLNGTHIGVEDIDAQPPAHINCRCYTSPVVSEKALSEKLDRILE